MKNCYDVEKINAYLDNELSREEKADFEAQLLEDANLREEVSGLQNLFCDLKELPKIETDRNFMVSLNEKIDQYEQSRNKKWYSKLLSLKPDYSPSQLGLASLSLVVVFTLTFFVTQNPSEGNPSLNAKQNINENPSVTDSDNSDKEGKDEESGSLPEDPVAGGGN